MKLLVDIGNQRLKWRLYSDSGTVGGGLFPASGKSLGNDLEQVWGSLPRPESAWASCVAGSEPRERIGRWLRDRWALDPVWVEARRAAGGVRNGYRNPTELGSDRWAVLVGARALAPEKGALVVDCGSAITVDALSAEGNFIGGVIMPGLAMMAASLTRGTGEIFLPETGVEFDDDPPAAIDACGRSTRAAVSNGILCAAVGGIEQALQAQRARLRAAPRYFLTGGDAGRLQGLLNEEFILEPDLVLQGLAVLAESGS
ncbi:MAG: type III pantothenate kinase [Pseudomonadota bacterium]|nr:type III pantothenate kinase [Pseudomonadota bacterium]